MEADKVGVGRTHAGDELARSVSSMEELVKAEFSGMAPWRFDSEIIECATEFGVVDLHNDATLDAISIHCRPRVAVEFSFHDSRREWKLTFTGVSGLTFFQDDQGVSTVDAWDPGSVETFIGAEYYEDGPNLPARFEMRVITGVLSMRAEHVNFIHSVETV